MTVLVIQTLQGNYPQVASVQEFPNWADAVTAAVQIAKENDAPDSEDTIRNELFLDGVYTPEKHAEWAVIIHKLEKVNET